MITDAAFASLDSAIESTTLDLLREAATHLSHLPINPITYGLLTKISAHLENPDVSAKGFRLKTIARQDEANALYQGGQIVVGTSRFTPAGLPVIYCEVQYPVVKITAPIFKDKPLDDHISWQRTVGRDIQNGVTIQLVRSHVTNTK